MSQIAFKGLEMHSSRMWNWNSIIQAFDFMNEVGLNSLILHKNEILDDIVMPNYYFSDSDLVWRRWPVRRSKTYSNAVYLKRVVEEAERRNISVFLEVKEIWYHESLLSLYPELVKENGNVCPTEKFWFEFLERKTSEALDLIPGIAGLIVSPATRESKVSISTRSCECERCKNTSDEEWYRQYIEAVYKPLKEAGKKMVVRDFAYSADAQKALVNAVKASDDKIILALKNVPHDFWPTYPNNVMIEKTTGIEKWIEFDVWGQYCGMGLFPCSLVEDFQKRMHYCVENGATGIILRTDWEICNDASCFNSFSILNLIGAAMISDNPDINLDEVYKKWTNYGLLSALHTESEYARPVVPSNPDAWKQLMDFMRTCWTIITKSLYVYGNAFQLSSKIQYSVQDFLYILKKHHSRSQWDPDSVDILNPTQEHIGQILAEKREALELVRRLPEILSVDTLGIPEEFASELKFTLVLYDLYIHQFYISAKIVFYSLADHNQKNYQEIATALNELIELRSNIKSKLENTNYAFYLYWLLDVDKLADFIIKTKEFLDSYEEQ